MKQCPQCRTTYTDDSLRYCLADGTELTSIGGEQETLPAARNEPVRVTIPNARPAKVVPPTAPQRKSSLGKIIAVLVAVGFLFVLILAAAGALIYFGTRHDNETENKNTVAVGTPTPSLTPDAEKQRLQDELANIQRRLDEQQKNANRTSPPPPPPSPTSSGTVTARVNSPNDGFLALRTQPDADYGDRIAKIPNGDLVTIENCNRNRVTIGGRAGRWCLVSWNGQEGYVFDAWLIY